LHVTLAARLGYGGFGSVWQAWWGGRMVAVKVMHRSLFTLAKTSPLDLLSSSVESFHREVSLLSRCARPCTSDRTQTCMPTRPAWLLACAERRSHARRLNHPRVVRLLGACLEPPESVFLVIELVEGGSLHRRLHQRGTIECAHERCMSGGSSGGGGGGGGSAGLPLSAVLQLARDVADAMAYLAEQGVVHCDLKPHNVLLDRYGRAKVCARK
jgi:serine/threonine protein kinase